MIVSHANWPQSNSKQINCFQSYILTAHKKIIFTNGYLAFLESLNSQRQGYIANTIVSRRNLLLIGEGLRQNILRSLKVGWSVGLGVAFTMDLSSGRASGQATIFLPPKISHLPIEIAGLSTQLIRLAEKIWDLARIFNKQFTYRKRFLCKMFPFFVPKLISN